jgi:putative transposase
MLSGALDLAQTVGVAPACAGLGVPRSSFYHAQQAPVPPAPRKPRPPSSRALSTAERQEVCQLLNSERFVDRAPRTLYAILLDEGRYLCSWRTMYRILAADAASKERRAQRRHPTYTRPELLATGPCQVWSWDITKLRGPLPGIWYSLYVILDSFSRKIVGWLIAEREDAVLAELLIAESCAREGIVPQQLTLHADRGAPMTSKTVAELLIDLGVARSHSRPSVSNDNPYSEAQFKTMKYGPTYPERFAGIEEAREWMRTFTTWYNTEHRHSGIALLAPQVVHSGQAPAHLAARQHVLDAAYQVHPERFVCGHPHALAVPTAVGINLPHPSVVVATAATAAPLPAAVPASRGNSGQRPLTPGALAASLGG